MDIVKNITELIIKKGNEEFIIILFEFLLNILAMINS